MEGGVEVWLYLFSLNWLHKLWEENGQVSFCVFIFLFLLFFSPGFSYSERWGVEEGINKDEVIGAENAMDDELRAPWRRRGKTV